MFDFDLDELLRDFKYGWLVFMAFIGGFIGYFRKHANDDKEKTLPAKLRSACLSILTSMFIAWCIYKLCLEFTTMKSETAVALAGLAAFSGTDLIVTIEEGMIDILKATINTIIKKITGGMG